MSRRCPPPHAWITEGLEVGDTRLDDCDTRCPLSPKRSFRLTPLKQTSWSGRASAPRVHDQLSPPLEICFHSDVSRDRSYVGPASAGLAGALFFVSLLFPAVATCISTPNAFVHWFENEAILFAGWLGALAGQFGWFANIPLAVNTKQMFIRRVPNATLAVLQSFFVAFAIFSLQPNRGMVLPHFEGPAEHVCELGSGFWLWACANVISVCGALYMNWSSRRGRT